LSFGKEKLGVGAREWPRGGIRDAPEDDVRVGRCGGIPEKVAGGSICGEEECDKGAVGRNARGLLGFAPIACRIMLSTIDTVAELTFTAWPLTACTLASPLRVFSDVRKTSAREGNGGGVSADVPGVPDLEG
jgi:hypothetical protein